MFYSASTGGFYLREIHGDAIPSDAVEITDGEHQALLAGQADGKRIVADSTGRPVLADPPAPTPEQVAKAMSDAVQSRVDAFVATKRYDSVDSASKYLTLTDEAIAAMPAENQEIVRRYRAEAQYVVAVTAQTWAVMERIESEVEAGTRNMPTSFADIEGELPALAWPQ